VTISSRAGRACAGVAALVVLLAGCGGGGGGGSQGYQEPKGASVATLTIDAGNFYYKPNAVDASAGINTVKLVGEPPQAGYYTLF